MNLFQKLLNVKDDKGNAIEPGQVMQLYKNTLSIAWPSTVEGHAIDKVFL